MKIMKVVELDLIAQRERLEYELENIINEKDDSRTKIKRNEYVLRIKKYDRCFRRRCN